MHEMDTSTREDVWRHCFEGRVFTFCYGRIDRSRELKQEEKTGENANVLFWKLDYDMSRHATHVKPLSDGTTYNLRALLCGHDFCVVLFNLLRTAASLLSSDKKNTYVTAKPFGRSILSLFLFYQRGPGQSGTTNRKKSAVKNKRYRRIKKKSVKRPSL
jgi:hypothetical protein